MKTLYMKFLVIISSCFLMRSNVRAQTYTFNPGTTYTAIMDTSQLAYDGIEITNTGSVDLNFTWELVLKDTLVDCEFDLCNSGICFSTLPVNGVMPTISSGQTGFLKLHMFTGQTNGVNAIKYVLKNAVLQTSDTLTFRIFVGNGSTGSVNHEALNLKPSLHPNPCDNFTSIHLILKELSVVSISVLDVSGQLAFTSQTSTLPAGEQFIPINTANLSKGFYTVSISTQSGITNHKLVINK